MDLHFYSCGWGIGLLGYRVIRLWISTHLHICTLVGFIGLWILSHLVIGFVVLWISSNLHIGYRFIEAAVVLLFLVRSIYCSHFNFTQVPGSLVTIKQGC